MLLQVPIMLTLCSMLSHTHYAQFYASRIGAGLELRGYSLLLKWEGREYMLCAKTDKLVIQCLRYVLVGQGTPSLALNNIHKTQCHIYLEARVEYIN